MQCFLRENDCLTIGTVQITVLEVRYDSVKLGITDPQATPCYSEEILYIQSNDDDGDDLESTFEPFEAEETSPFAIPMV